MKIKIAEKRYLKRKQSSKNANARKRKKCNKTRKFNDR